MPGGSKKKNRKKRGQRRKQQQQNQNGTPPQNVDLDTVMKQADSAAEASDLHTALRLYEYVAGVLRKKVSAANSSGQQENGPFDEALLLASVLSKLGEVKVSTEDGEGGRADFLEAISLLGGGESGEVDDAEMEDTPMMQDEEGNNDDDTEQHDKDEIQRQQNFALKSANTPGGVVDAMEIAQRHEMKAGLHLYVGQLSSAEEALRSYKGGVREWEKCIYVLEGIEKKDVDMKEVEEEGGEQVSSPAEALVEAKRQLVGAHCSIAELFMTDLCYEPDAESQCESSLQAALSLDNVGSSQPDALQTMANLRLSQNRGLEAVNYMLDAYQQMKVGVEAMSNLVGLGRDDDKKGMAGEDDCARELVDVEAASSLPGFEFRCQSAKLFLECASVLEDQKGKHGDDEQHGTMNNDDDCVENLNDDDTTKKKKQAACIEAAIQLLGSLLSENDEVVEIWYLLGVAFMAATPPNSDEARFYWEKALEMLHRVKEGLEEETAASSGGNGGEEEEMQEQLDAVKCQIEEINQKLVDVGEIDRCNMATDD